MPTTRMAVAALLRESLFQTIDYMKRKEKAKGDITKMPGYNAKWEALIPVVKGQLPIKVHAHRADDILTAIRIAKEFKLKMTLDHCTEGHLIVDQVKASGFLVERFAYASEQQRDALYYRSRNECYQTKHQLPPFCATCGSGSDS